MKEENRRQVSDESRQQVSKTLGTNERTQRKSLQSPKVLAKIPFVSKILRAHEVAVRM
jgi:hypothetical protein